MHEIRFSDLGDYDVRRCTPDVDNFTTVSSATFAIAAGLLGTAVIGNGTCFISIR